MPEPKLFECPACGSPLTTDGEKPELTCPYCGRTIIVPESLRVHPEPTPAPPAQTWHAPPASTSASSARAQRTGGGCVYLPLTLIVIALVVVGYLALFGQDKGLSSLQAAVGYSTPTPTVVPVSRPLTASLPRQAQYANLRFSVNGGTITNQIPAAATNHESLLPGNRAHAYLDMKVNNPTTNGIVADPNLIALRLIDGQRYQEESGWGDWIASQSSMARKLYFTVPLTATWEGAQLLIGKAGKEPATILLDGQSAQARYPLVLNDKGKATVQEVDYEMQSAAVDLDSEGKRADTGRRFLKFSLRIFNHNRAGSGAMITSANFRLVAGGDLLAPVKAPSEVVQASSVLQGEVVFDAPAGISRVELQVGDVGGSGTRRLPVNLPAP
jgi:DNA-directed RNA polymerase subunit RPC12/RpoP